MPKMKTHKGAKKRFHISGTGKVLRTKGPKGHFRRRKAARVKRLFGGLLSDYIAGLTHEFGNCV